MNEARYATVLTPSVLVLLYEIISSSHYKNLHNASRPPLLKTDVFAIKYCCRRLSCSPNSGACSGKTALSGTRTTDDPQFVRIAACIKDTLEVTFQTLQYPKYVRVYS